jgi:hypothetical protein
MGLRLTNDIDVLEVNGTIGGGDGRGGSGGAGRDIAGVTGISDGVVCTVKGRFRHKWTARGRERERLRLWPLWRIVNQASVERLNLAP